MGTGKRGELVNDAIALVQHSWEKACREGFKGNEPFHGRLKPEGLRYPPVQLSGAVDHPLAVMQMVDSLLRALPNPAIWPYYAHKLARLYQGLDNTQQRISAILAGLMRMVEDVLQDNFTEPMRQAWHQVCDYVCACCCLFQYRESRYSAVTPNQL